VEFKTELVFSEYLLSFLVVSLLASTYLILTLQLVTLLRSV